MGALNTLLLLLGLVVSGTCIPLILTFQNRYIMSEHDHDPVYFRQPLLQTAMIFIGEIICILVVQLGSKNPIPRDRSVSSAIEPASHAHAANSTNNYGDHPDWAATHATSLGSFFWFIIPSACNLIATTLMNVGLFYSTPSVYQMVRSSIVGFLAVFSFLLPTKLRLGAKWIAVATTLVGTAIISWGAYHVDWKGPMYLLASQLFMTGQLVFEEILMGRYHLDPIKAMGIEGAYRTFLLVASLVTAFMHGSDLLDVKTGLTLVLASPALWQSALALAFAVAVFSYLALEASCRGQGLGQSVIETLRALVVWVIAIHLTWDTFSWLEMGGFLVLTLGMFALDGICEWIGQCIKCPARQNETTPLLV